MKKLILTAIKCDGLTNGDTKTLTPQFRGQLMGSPVDTERRWKQWGNPTEIPDPPPSRNIPNGRFNGKIYLMSPANERLFVSRETILSSDSGAMQTLFDPVNPSTADASISPRLRYTIQ